MVNANERKTEEKIKIELIKAKYAKRNIRYIVKKINKKTLLTLRAPANWSLAITIKHACKYWLRKKALKLKTS